MRQLLHPIWKSGTLLRAFYSTAAKGQLATLRKQTGYSIKNCRSALEIHGNDLEAAIKWLNDEAQKQGWEKATKLQNRATTQGLIGVHIKNNTAALVEVCCETDFVAKNTIFQDLVKIVTSACCNPQSTQQKLFSEEQLEPESMNNTNWDGKILKEHVAHTISQLGENIILRRGHLLHANKELFLSASVHPNTGETTTPFVGTYGALVALKMTAGCTLNKESIEGMGRQLCMHIIGMKPKYILQRKDKVQVEDVESRQSEEQSQMDNAEQDFLLGQAFVFNDDLTVEQLLLENSLEVVHFLRFERGETPDVD